MNRDMVLSSKLSVMKLGVVVAAMLASAHDRPDLESDMFGGLALE